MPASGAGAQVDAALDPTLDAEVGADPGSTGAPAQLPEAGAPAVLRATDAGFPAPTADPEPVVVAPVDVPPSGDPLVDRLRGCGILDEGPFRVVGGDDPYMSCLRACWLTAPCDSLTALFCHWPAPEISRCMQPCVVPADADSGASCDDTTPIWPSMRCNGVFNCMDHSDEQGCDTFDCGDPDGRVVVIAERCNGTTKCANGADEQGCAKILCPP